MERVLKVPNYFEFAGRKSTEFGMRILADRSFPIPERDVQRIEAPGISGDNFVDQGRFKNITMDYPVNIYAYNDLTIAQICGELSKWLRGRQGYSKLFDTVDERYYRYAQCFATPDVKDVNTRFGNNSISFDCKPYKYAITGSQTFVVSQNGRLQNVEIFPSLPVITIYGNGDINFFVNNYKVVLKGIQGQITIDSERQIAYKPGTLLNNKVNTYPFPQLDVGENRFTWTGNVTKVEVTPNWRTI
ncbi:phage tail domain-containing protein [Listeria booriae]|uniref:phage tail domain-containing protein n=1 Tax=Listeria booriae TaxID=1552123 RepID=UPI0016295E0A|nr:phage tail domain-containing protein [Listeria booriae]MBC2100639.1 hypothetical protein [Listeria booriae]MBC2196806.1 hypothetical protein [Listeria booriae]